MRPAPSADDPAPRHPHHHRHPFPTPGLARERIEARDSGPAWGLDACLGRVVEISSGPASAGLSLALRLVHEAQRRAEPAAWITPSSSAFHPPDAAATGVDLEALVVVLIRDGQAPHERSRGRRPRTSSLPIGAARAADQLLRSGAFGLVVVDLDREHRVPPAAITRLAGLAKKHAAALVFLTRKDSASEASISPLVVLRIDAVRRRGEDGSDTTLGGGSALHTPVFIGEAHVIRDKRGISSMNGSTIIFAETFRAPPGLR